MNERFEQLEFNFDTEISPMDKMILDVAVNEAIKRIYKGYNLTNGKTYLSFSGGKDSTVVAELIKMANLPTNIQFVYSNTGIEFDAIKNFAINYDYDNLVVVKPRKPFGRILKEYGLPAISKMKSELIATYDKNINNNPLQFVRVQNLIIGEAQKNGVKLGYKTRVALAKKHFHFLHPDRVNEYNIANKCCLYMKKYPFQDFAKENDMNGYFSGTRTAEGGARSMVFKTCTSVKKVNGKQMTHVMPIYDWSDELLYKFIKYYNVKLSEAYTVYGAERTGCVGCPFARNCRKELEMVHEFEPLRYKAANKWLKTVYMDQGIKLEFDKEYMKEFEERDKLNEQRRKEMLERYGNLRFNG